MILGVLRGRRSSPNGSAVAVNYLRHRPPNPRRPRFRGKSSPIWAMEHLLRRVDSEVRPCQLTFLRKRVSRIPSNGG